MEIFAKKKEKKRKRVAKQPLLTNRCSIRAFGSCLLRALTTFKRVVYLINLANLTDAPSEGFRPRSGLCHISMPNVPTRKILSFTHVYMDYATQVNICTNTN